MRVNLTDVNRAAAFLGSANFFAFAPLAEQTSVLTASLLCGGFVCNVANKVWNWTKGKINCATQAFCSNGVARELRHFPAARPDEAPA